MFIYRRQYLHVHALNACCLCVCMCVCVFVCVVNPCVESDIVLSLQVRTRNDKGERWNSNL